MGAVRRRTPQPTAGGHLGGVRSRAGVGSGESSPPSTPRSHGERSCSPRVDDIRRPTIGGRRNDSTNAKLRDSKRSGVACSPVTTMSDSALHHARMAMLGHALDASRELVDLLDRRRERDESVVVMGSASGRSSWVYVDPVEEARIAELREIVEVFRSINWRRLRPPIQPR